MGVGLLEESVTGDGFHQRLLLHGVLVLQFVYDGFVDEVVDGYAYACGELGDAGREPGGHPRIEFATGWFHGFNSPRDLHPSR